MSAKELRLKSAVFNYDIIVEQSKTFDCINIGRYVIDRDQAHLLMLYLHEHLGYITKEQAEANARRNV